MTKNERFNYAPKEEGPITPDMIVKANGNWKIVYCYNNWGDNILMILPNFMVDDEEQAMCLAATECPSGTFEQEGLCRQWMKEFPNSPFMIQRPSFAMAVTELYRRLELLEGDYNKFIEQSIEFDKWLHAVYAVEIEDGESLMYTAYHEGWRTIWNAMGNQD